MSEEMKLLPCPDCGSIDPKVRVWIPDATSKLACRVTSGRTTQECDNAFHDAPPAAQPDYTPDAQAVERLAREYEAAEHGLSGTPRVNRRIVAFILRRTLPPVWTEKDLRAILNGAGPYESCSGRCTEARTVVDHLLSLHEGDK